MGKEVFTRNKLSDKDVIQSYYAGETAESDMTDHQLERLRRVRLCVSLLLDAKPHFQVIGQMIKVFGISQNTAYIDKRISESLFGKILKADKEMHRAVAIEMAKSDRQAAMAAGDLKARNAATRNYIEAAGIKNDDPELPDFTKLQPSLVIALLPPGMEQKIDQLLQGGVVNLNDLPGPTPVTEDIEHEEVDP